MNLFGLIGLGIGISLVVYGYKIAHLNHGCWFLHSTPRSRSRV